MNDNLLKPVDDGLPMRYNREHSRDKLRVLEGYIHRFVTSMHGKPWRALYYIDLMAGPGKNSFNSSPKVELGSPLLALTAKRDFTDFRFVEYDRACCDALAKRVASSNHDGRVQVFYGDGNEKVNDIVQEIRRVDGRFIGGKWPSLSLAFLDPEGLELHWDTVEKLGQMKRMDLIINFSTQGITRNAQKFLETNATESIDRFFGTTDWQEEYLAADGNITRVRRNLLDLYKARLQKLGYQVVEPDPTNELVFKNSKNVQMFTLLGASKHELGVKFWQDTISRRGSSGQIRMF